MMADKSKPDWEFFQLSNQAKMPAIGLGTYRMKKEEEVMRAVDAALGAGYRLFDTASVYGNETHLKKAFDTYLPKYKLEREDLFIISKPGPNEMYSKNAVINAYTNSLKNLGLEYLDLYLIHFPGVPHIEPTNTKHKIFRNNAWTALLELYEDNRVSAIGVSNYTKAHLDELVEARHHTLPAVNQIEWHPHFHDDEVSKLCRQYDICLQGYSSLGGLNSHGILLKDPTVKSIAAELGVTEAQVLLTWSLQCDVAVIPKSTNPEHIRSNFMLDVKLNDEQMRTLNKLHTGKKFAWDAAPYL